MKTNDQDKKKTTADILIKLGLENCTLFHDERNNSYAALLDKGVRRISRLRGREFSKWFAGIYYKKINRVANKEAISNALSVLEAKASFDGSMLKLSNRFVMRDGNIYIDMADENWRVVKVTPDGWEILNNPPILFRRYSHQQPLPDPIHGGTLSDIHHHLSIKNDGDKLLVEVWLVACAFPDVPRPAITFHGLQGSSKTTTARILKSLSDPSLTESVDIGRSPPELAQILDHHGVPCFDNLTDISGWASDMLCRGVTGGAFTKRELYSDDEDIILNFKRPIIITGINIPTHAPDLLDRLLLIELERILPDKRIDETTFWNRFNADKPKIFGALLDAITGTMRHLPNIKLGTMPRMADFARIACAYAEYTGIGSERMLDVIMRHTERQTQEVIDSDPLATVVCDFVQEKGSWTGTAAALLKLLIKSAPTSSKDLPKAPNVLSRKLKTLHATLFEVGISFRHSGKRLLTLEVIESTEAKDEVSPTVSPVRESNKENSLDDTNDRDDKIHPLSGNKENHMRI